ncbi:phage protease [Sulfuriflexus mobilis]|uniref:phage protease n=1 Tax=Sulfuriflexus mobilis TaxID=1811807 RepID=UPI000F83D094|nr:phage protease [Sulfuriflexus mobilis]
MHKHHDLAIAVNKALESDQRIALCFALPEDGSVPEWVELVPAGDVKGVDGRKWINDRPQAILDYHKAMQAQGRDLPFDWEHSTEIKAPKGEEAPASAWGVEMQNREGVIWARPEWTERGRNSIASREYRYLSPVLVYEKNTRRIVGIASVGLTNSPNLNLTALNREMNPDSIDHEENPMDEALLQALGLTKDANLASALNAINQLKGDLTTANNRAESPSLEKFVPRADHDQALERAANAEQKLADHEAATLDADIETAINSALEAGKITPGTAEFHKANCRQEGGLARFNDYVAAAPVVAAASDLDGKTVPGETDKALNAEQKKIDAMFGHSSDDVAKHADA